MAKEDFDAFIDNMRSDRTLAEAFSKAAADVARDAGYDVTEADILEQVGVAPATRRLPGGPGTVTTMALGEEGSRPSPLPPASVTCAIGEEDKHKSPPTRATTMAVGEEGKKPPRFS